MLYRVCKSFEIESGHMLSKHPSLCRFLHGHSRRIDVVLASETLDAGDMVCDFKTLKLALHDYLARLDHAMAVNSQDPVIQTLSPAQRERLVIFNNTDPTTEVLARSIFDYLCEQVAAARTYTDDRANQYRFPPGLVVERVRVSETSSTWAEYART